MSNKPCKTANTPARRPDCMHKMCMSNSGLTVSGYLEQDATDKTMKGLGGREYHTTETQRINK